jgi:hypothetical protein
MATWYQKQQDKLKYEDLNQQEKEARQALEQAKAAYWNNVGNLKRGTWNNALERNIARSTIPQADIDRGMVPLDQGLTFANQNLENALSSIGRNRRAYDLYVKHRDYRPPKPPTDPDAPSSTGTDYTKLTDDQIKVGIASGTIDPFDLPANIQKRLMVGNYSNNGVGPFKASAAVGGHVDGNAAGGIVGGGVSGGGGGSW